MRIDRTGQSTGAAPSRGARAAEGFRLDAPAAPAVAAPPAALRAAASASLDAVLTLQGAGSQPAPAPQVLERSLRRGRRVVDALDGLRIALLGGRVSAADLDRLRRTLDAPQDRDGATGDADLDGALAWAEVRLAVEAAKLERR